MPGTERQSDKLVQANLERSNPMGCPVFIVGFVIFLIVLALFFL